VARFEVEVSGDALKGLERLASRLKAAPEEVLRSNLESMAEYAGDLARWGLELRVRRENRVQALFDEVYFYAVEAWRSVVSRILDRLKARGRFELTMLDFDPDEPSIEVELVALEGSDLLADKLVIHWSLDGVTIEAYYYLEEGEEPPLQRAGDGYDWAYLPDERAVVVTVRARSLREAPPVHVLDKYSGLAD